MKKAHGSRTAFVFGAVLCAAFFVLYAFLPLSAPLRFTSPDENANHFFARRFAESGVLWKFEALNLVADGVVHPRSTRVIDGFVVPGGFIGLPVLFGTMAKAAGTAAIPYFTPLFALLGCFAWGALVSRAFGRGVGTIAAITLMAQPVWWYESSRTLMPNVPFFSLLVSGAWFLAAAPFARAIERRAFSGLPLLRRADGPIGGVLVALAAAVRPSEAYWIALAAFAAVLALRKALPVRRLLLAAAFAAAVLVPFLILQQATYGSAIATGYGSGIADGAVPEVPHGLGDRLLGPVRPWLFPLGFAPRTALAHFWTYGISFFPWWSLAVALAVGAAILRRRVGGGGKLPVEAKAGIAAAAAASAWLILFYRSWTVQDNPDPAAVTIGSSYFRYWLPIFAFSTVPVAWAARRLLAGRARFPRAAVAALAFAAYVAVSGTAVFLSPQEGIVAVRAATRSFDAAARFVASRTPEDSVIVADRADKFLFPDRRVVQPFRADATFKELPALQANAPLFYFGITLPEEDLAFLREERLASLGLTIDPVGSIGAESLYSITAAASAGRR